MRNVKILAAAGLMTMAGIAQADVTGTATIVSDYDWRGWTQTNYEPALQLSIDYASAGGWYVGTWGSNVGAGLSGSDPSTEVDVYTGFKGEFGEGFGWDVGLNYYSYPGASDINTVEIYGKLSYSILTGSLYYTDDYFDSESAYYIGIDAAIPAGPLSINLHAGLSDGDAFDYPSKPDAFYTDGYTDYSIGVSYTASNLTLGIKWVTQDSDDIVDKDDRVILSVSTALPW